MQVQNPEENNQESAAGRALYERAMSFAASRLGLVILLVATAFVLSISIGSTTGLHGDEAWSMMTAHNIAAGERPVRGMNSYTGPLHLYLMTPVFEVFGYTTTVLRVFGAFFNVVLLLSFVLIARELLPRKRHAAWLVGLLLLTSPVFVIFGRLSTEITSLVPAFVFVGTWLVLRSCLREGQKGSMALAGVGGLVAGLAVYTHVIAVCVPVSICIGVLAVERLAIFRRLNLWAAGVCFVLGFSPLFLLAARSEGGSSKWGHAFEGMVAGNFVADILEVPEVILGTLDGSYLYQRFVGEEAWPVLPYIGLGLVCIVVLRALSLRIEKLTKLEVGCWVASICFVVLTLAISSRLSLRYFLFLELSVPLLVVISGLRIAVAMPKTTRWLVGGAVACAVISSAYLTNNYFVTYARTGGSCSVFPLGTRLIETSNHFIDTSTLHKQLREAGVRTLYSKDFIGWPIRVYEIGDPKEDRTTFRAMSPGRKVPQSLGWARGKVAVVFYNGVMTISPSKTEDVYLDATSFKLRGRVFEMDKSFDSHFRVYLAEEEFSAAQSKSVRREREAKLEKRKQEAHAAEEQGKK